MSRCCLITGGTGLVGAYVLDRLADNPDLELHVLLRARGKKDALRRLALLGDYFGRPEFADRVHLHAGQITEPGLGLSGPVLSMLRQKVTDVVHAAASISFVDRDANRRVNRQGTENLLAVMPVTARLFYISTAYVAGLAESLSEDQLDIGQSFRNDYESSKLETERLVRECFTDRPHLLTVCRPSIVTGEWTNGRTFQFFTVYRVLRALSVFARRYPGETFHLGYDPEGTQNYIPVDRLADMLEEVITRPRRWGKTYHMVNDTPVRNCDFRTYLEKRFGFAVINREPGLDSLHLNRSIVMANEAYLSYLKGEPRFACEARNQLVSSQSPMTFDAAYLDRILAFCEQTSWGKRIAIHR